MEGILFQCIELWPVIFRFCFRGGGEGAGRSISFWFATVSLPRFNF